MSPLTFNNYVKPACLPYGSFAPEETEDTSVKAVASGWGQLRESRMYFPCFNKQALNRLLYLKNSRM